MEQHITKCPICGKDIHQKRILRIQKHCSCECAAIAMQKRSKFQCANCGKEIFIKPHQKGRKKYCSVDCCNDSKILQKGAQRICKVCNVEKNINEFVKTKDRASGRNYVCKSCACDKQKERYAQGLCYQKKGRTKSTVPKKIRRAIASKKYNTKPDIVVKLRKYEKEKKNQWCASLHDSYVKDALKAHLHIKSKDINQDMIELKRQQLIIHRELKQLKGELKNGTT